jgi:hypothetical protein
MKTDESWKLKTVLVGGLLGAFAGMAAGYLLVRRSEASGEQPKLGTGEGLRLGLLVLGLLRQVSQLGEGQG